MPVGTARVSREFLHVDLRVRTPEDDHTGAKTEGGPERMADIDAIGWSVERDTGETALGEARCSLYSSFEPLFGRRLTGLTSISR